MQLRLTLAFFFLVTMAAVAVLFPGNPAAPDQCRARAIQHVPNGFTDKAGHNRAIEAYNACPGTGLPYPTIP